MTYATVPTEAVILEWYCVGEECSDEDIHPQPLKDIMDVGTLICPECGEDMVLTEDVRVL